MCSMVKDNKMYSHIFLNVISKVHTNKQNVNKFEIDIIFKFNTTKDSKEFVLASLIPASNHFFISIMSMKIAIWQIHTCLI